MGTASHVVYFAAAANVVVCQSAHRALVTAVGALPFVVLLGVVHLVATSQTARYCQPILADEFAIPISSTLSVAMVYANEYGR